MSLYRRIRDRKIVQWLIGYGGAAWVVAQVVQVVAEAWGLPDGVQRATQALLFSGFFLALVVAWFHGERGRQSLPLVEVVLIVGILVAGGFFVRGAMGPTRSVSSSGAVESLGLAVLPFESVSRSDDAYVAAGLHSEVVTRLSEGLPLRVLSGAATQRFAGYQGPPQDIARDLGVDLLLASTVRVEGDRVRTDVQLLDGSSAELLWSASYDGDLSAEHLLDMQADISRQVAESLNLRLTPPETRPVESSAAYLLFLRALELEASSYDVAGPQRVDRKLLSLDLLQQSIDLEPDFADAHAHWAIGTVRWLNQDLGAADLPVATVDSLHDRARAAAETARRLAPTSPAAYSALAHYRHFAQRDFPAAVALADSALVLNPSAPSVWTIKAAAVRRMGHTEDAIDALRELTALEPERVQWWAELSATLVAANRLDEAAHAADSAVAVVPMIGLNSRASVQIHAGDLVGLRTTVEDCLDLDQLGCELMESQLAFLSRDFEAAADDISPLWRGMALVRSGREQLGDEVLRKEVREQTEATREAEARCPGSGCGPMVAWLEALSLAQAELGEDETAMQSLERAEQLRRREPRDLWFLNDFSRERLFAFVALDENERALAELDGLLAGHFALSLTVPLARLHPLLDPLRTDPAFEAMLERYATN